MTIRSVDMQVLVQKVGDVARIQQSQQLENNSRQQEFVQQISQQTDKNAKTVNQMLRNEQAYVHEKQEKEESGKKKRTKKGKSEKMANKDKMEARLNNPGNKLDITV
ncbi:MAG: hypothetical protein PHP26_01370 [Syntrophomonas sp.]|uniref:hypothetical protein n=1 Tax=Syntrophomonas sp. TaxID=2053627 RepID=UPI002631DB71|nr:hypothetical protein [Syntrophomonas sp.]MDD2510037.1 hypothetical protein [Syntrophomonas sp.]MDD3878625.1 hypothetical protein [Syntrophomonas sp.]MDD4626086.1 hypothetical protein [Syntrophomonas sp.]